MKLLISIALITGLCMTGSNLYAQTDDDNIQQARATLDAQHNCDGALRYLSLVSADGHTKAAYNLQMGRANDCKTNIAQAIYYYNKFLEFQPANDSVKRRVAELSDDKAQQARVANEERIARGMNEEHTPHSSHTKKSKKKHYCLEDNYYSFGIGYGMALGGDNAPYKSAFEVNGDYGFALAKNKLLLECSFNADFLTNPSIDWFARACELSSSQVSGLASGFDYNIHFALMPVVVNKKNIALAVGPLAGIGFISISDMGDYSFETGNAACLYYGARANLFLGQYAIIYLQYGQMGANTATVDLPIGISNTITQNQSMLTLGVRLRFGGYWGMWW
jgi:hypothetical protein